MSVKVEEADLVLLAASASPCVSNLHPRTCGLFFSWPFDDDGELAGGISPLPSAMYTNQGLVILPDVHNRQQLP